MAIKAWNLVADIGGTNARFGLEDYANTSLQLVKHYSVAEYADFADALQHFLEEVAALSCWLPQPQAACMAVACPIDRQVLEFTNSSWTIDPSHIRELLADARVTLINDFAAVGYAVTALKPKDWFQIGGGVSEGRKPIAILGPGTGLGVCSLIPVGSSYQVIESEGGHVDFAPITTQEIAVLEVLNKRFERVSVERLLSGAGILNIYQALAEIENTPVVFETPKQITAAAIANTAPLAVETLAMFCQILGSVAANLVLTFGAKGGVYIAGGIVPNFIEFLEKSDFRRRFEAKGRYKRYLQNVPVRVITKEDIGLFGAIKKLNLAEI